MTLSFKTRTLLALLLLSSSLSYAESLTSYLPQGCYHLGEYKQFKTVTGMVKPLITEGSFVFNCQYGLIWHTQEPIIESAIYKIQGDYVVLRENSAPQKLDNRVYRALGKLLNNLIGGNEEYLQKNFTLVEKNTAIELTPNNKQMQKFLHKLTLSRQENAINIHLDVAEQETLDITIFSQRNLDSLEQHQCETLINVPSAACKILFEGTKP